MRSPEGMALAILCLDYGYKLANHPKDLTRDQINFLIAALNYRLEIIRKAIGRKKEEEYTRKIIITD